MKANKFPYQEFERVPAWAVIEQAIESLVQNKDLIEQTNRRYIVGLLIKRLSAKGMLTAQAAPKVLPQRQKGYYPTISSRPQKRPKKLRRRGGGKRPAE